MNDEAAAVAESEGARVYIARGRYRDRYGRVLHAQGSMSVVILERPSEAVRCRTENIYIAEQAVKQPVQ